MTISLLLCFCNFSCSSQVIDDPTKVFKLIKDSESEEGYDGKMDRKSLQRLLARLAAEGQVKNILVKLSFGERTKTLHFICDPGMQCIIKDSFLKPLKRTFLQWPRTWVGLTWIQCSKVCLTVPGLVGILLL